MSTPLRLVSLIAVPFLLLPAAAAADTTARPLADAALDGTDKRITKAYFFVGPYFVRYDWGKDRVDDGYPVAIDPNAVADPGWTADINAANSVFGQHDSFLFRGGQFMFYDWDAKKHTHRVEPLSNFPGGVDSVVHGLGAEHNFDYFFVGGEYVKFDRRTKTPGERGSIAERFKLDRVDAAVNGAGNFIGFAYLFQDDKYVKYDWAAGRVVGGKSKLTQPNFPGLVEMIEVAHGLRLSRTWYGAALPALRADLAAAQKGEPSTPATGKALKTAFGVDTVELRMAHLPEILQRLEASAHRAKDPAGTFRFKTAPEAAKDGFDVARAIYADKAAGVSVTPAWHGRAASCQATLTIELLTQLGGLTSSTTDANSTASRMHDSFYYAVLVRLLGDGGSVGICKQ